MTKQEKLVIYFLIAMLALGLAVKFYKACFGRVNLKVERTKVDINNIIKEKAVIKINTAMPEDFARLPGIGMGIGKRIVDYRDKNGNFTVIEDIKKVSGIGDKKYEQIKDSLVLE